MFVALLTELVKNCWKMQIFLSFWIVKGFCDFIFLKSAFILRFFNPLFSLKDCSEIVHWNSFAASFEHCWDQLERFEKSHVSVFFSPCISLVPPRSTIIRIMWLLIISQIVLDCFLKHELERRKKKSWTKLESCFIKRFLIQDLMCSPRRCFIAFRNKTLLCFRLIN